MRKTTLENSDFEQSLRPLWRCSRELEISLGPKNDLVIVFLVTRPTHLRCLKSSPKIVRMTLVDYLRLTLPSMGELFYKKIMKTYSAGHNNGTRCTRDRTNNNYYYRHMLAGCLRRFITWNNRV